MLASILLVVTLGTPAISAAAANDEAAVRFSGEWTLAGAVFTDVPIDPEDPTGPWRVEAESASLLVGDFVGVDHSTTSGTFDPRTGEFNGYIWETFVGTYAPDGSAGIMRREGPFEGNTNTGEFQYNQRITGGDGDFEGSRGHMTVLAVPSCHFLPGVPCVGSGGTYHGTWVRP